MRSRLSRSGPPVGSEGLVRILSAHLAPGYRIPRQASCVGSMQLDLDHIERITESTQQAAALLAAVFDAANEDHYA